MGWFKTLVSFITDPIADLTGGYVERKRIAAEMAADVARAENNFKTQNSFITIIILFNFHKQFTSPISSKIFFNFISSTSTITAGSK